MPIPLPVLGRRPFLAASAATCALATIGPRPARAAQFTRKSLESPDVAEDLETYKEAVRAMLALPPDDPRNWYRNAMTHLLDCPHGNWWFLVWHRGYLGWLERICREVTGKPAFALPFWDWTAEPKVPDSFWGDVLQPGTEGYVEDFATFEARYRGPAEAYWNGFSPAQLEQQRRRGMPTFEDFWGGVRGAFFPADATRELTADDPDFNARTRNAVAPPTIRAALSPSVYVTDTGRFGFGSSIADNHHQRAALGKSILESQPHDLVHDNIGGFMGFFLSPSDPIFFMHHSNIDRLWDLWTRKQQARGLPIGPDDSQWPAYSGEEFLFFHDAAGAPVTRTQAGDYFAIGDFDYGYEPGSGEDAMGVPVAAAGPSVTVSGLSERFAVNAAAGAEVALPGALATALRAPDDRHFFASVTIETPADAMDLAFDVFVAPEGAAIDPTIDGPNFAGSFAFFGHPPPEGTPVTFAVALTEVVEGLRAAGALGDDTDLQVVVVATPAGAETATLTAPPAAGAPTSALRSVTIGQF